MDVRTVKRILYGLVAIAFLVIAGREFQGTGHSAEAGLASLTGLYLAILAVTGKG